MTNGIVLDMTLVGNLFLGERHVQLMDSAITRIGKSNAYEDTLAKDLFFSWTGRRLDNGAFFDKIG